MIIKQTQQAIEFYELAITNAQNMIGFQVNQDEKYQEFKKKYKKIATTLFHSHDMSFSFYDFSGSEMKNYFKIEDGEITFQAKNIDVKYPDYFENIEDVAQELLVIVKRFYE